MIALCYHVNQKYSVNCLVVSVLSEVAKCLLYNLIAVSGLFLFVMVMQFFLKIIRGNLEKSENMKQVIDYFRKSQNVRSLGESLVTTCKDVIAMSSLVLIADGHMICRFDKLRNAITGKMVS